MAEFAYKARSKDGTVVSGELSSPDRASAILRVERLYGTPISIKPATGQGGGGSAGGATSKKLSWRERFTGEAGKAKKPEAPRPVLHRADSGKAGVSEQEQELAQAPEGIRLSQRQLLLFTKQLSKLLKSGMTLEKALSALGERASTAQLRVLLKNLHQMLTEGARFSVALERFPKTFSRIYISLIAAGESSGSLPLILRRLATYLEQNHRLVQSVKFALVYPFILAGVGVVAIIVFVTFVVPKLTGLLESTGSTLPLPTRMLIASYEFTLYWWWAMIALPLALLALFQGWVATEAGRLAWDRIKLGMPVVGRLIQTRFCAQAAMTLGTLLGQGVLLSKALELIKNIGGNADLALRMDATISQVEDGAALSSAAESTQVFPEMFIQMLQVGERTGDLADSLDGIAENYEEEVENQAKLISTLVPVIVILAIAVVLGVVVFCIFIAIINVASGLRRGASLEAVMQLPWV